MNYVQIRRVVSTSLLMSLLVAGLPGCDRDRVFEENREMKDREWRLSDTPTFAFAITDTAARYSVFLNVRTTAGYQFYNVFVKLRLTGPNGQIISQRLHEMNVRDPQTGEPLGDGAGDIFDHQFQALRGVRFGQAGTYRAELEQYMRLPTLPNVMDVGIRVARETPGAP